MGSREYRTDGSLDGPAAGWDDLVSGLFRTHAEPRLLEQSEGGYRLIGEYMARSEPKLADSRELAPLSAWVGKAVPGQMLRIAAVLHCAAGRRDDVVGMDCLQAAVRVTDYFLSHARTIWNAKEENAPLDIAKRVLDYITLNRTRRFCKGLFRRVLYSGRHANEKVLADAYAILAAAHVIREDKSTRQTTYFLVNPRLWAATLA